MCNKAALRLSNERQTGDVWAVNTDLVHLYQLSISTRPFNSHLHDVGRRWHSCGIVAPCQRAKIHISPSFAVSNTKHCWSVYRFPKHCLNHVLLCLSTHSINTVKLERSYNWLYYSCVITANNENSLTTDQLKIYYFIINTQCFHNLLSQWVNKLAAEPRRDKSQFDRYLQSNMKETLYIT